MDLRKGIRTSSSHPYRCIIGPASLAGKRASSRQAKKRNSSFSKRILLKGEESLHGKRKVTSLSGKTFSSTTEEKGSHPEPTKEERKVGGGLENFRSHHSTEGDFPQRGSRRLLTKDGSVSLARKKS